MIRVHAELKQVLNSTYKVIGGSPSNSKTKHPETDRIAMLYKQYNKN